MTSDDIIKITQSGETSRVQFKLDFDNQDKIASEIIAMSNASGGVIVFGVEDSSGNIIGLEYERIQYIGNKLATIANDLIKPQVYVTVEVIAFDEDYDDDLAGKRILVVHVDEGSAKPYKDSNGTIWIKQGSDKRKVTDNNEIMRLFQQSGLTFVDEMPIPHTSIEDIDREKVIIYVKKIAKDIEDNEIIYDEILYQNLGILKNTHLTLSGLMYFSKTPQKYRPAFCVKAIAFYGNNMGGLNYRDSRDILGTIPDLYRESILFFKSNLKHIQKGQDFNSVGVLEISEIALDEIVQNALIHRDYTHNAPTRLMIFDDRIEIVSPGRLPNNLTVDKIKLGNAVMRNNQIASYAAKLIKYRGFGTGIIRALNEQPNIEFYNDVEGNQFIVKIPRESYE